MGEGLLSKAERESSERQAICCEASTRGCLLSIVIPTYNRSRLLVRQLDRLGESTSAVPFEVIVVDDGSTDDTHDVVLSYANKHVRYYWQQNAGVSSARNRGIAEARGSYVTFLDSDDLVHLEWLPSLSALLNEGKCAMAFCGAQVFRSNGSHKRSLLPHDMGRLFCNVEGRFIPGTYVVSRGLLTRVGGFDTDLKYGENNELAIRLCKFVRDEGMPTCVIPRVLVDFYEHQGLRGSASLVNKYWGNVLTVSKHQDAMRQNRGEAANYLGVAGVSALRLEEYGLARKALLGAIRYSPTRAKNYFRLMLTLPFLRRWNIYD